MTFPESYLQTFSEYRASRTWMAKAAHHLEQSEIMWNFLSDSTYIIHPASFLQPLRAKPGEGPPRLRTITKCERVTPHVNVNKKNQSLHKYQTH